MTIPTTAHEYYFPKIGSADNLTIRKKTIEWPKTNEVLVKVHAVSLQFRDLMVSTGTYSAECPDANLVPCSDMAGEIIAVGEDVKGWKIGDRVCSNFATEHIHGDISYVINKSALGGQSPGVLTEYRTFPSYSLVLIPDHLTYQEASTLPCAAVTAYNALHGPVPMKAGDYVLVLGTGGVSIFALQLAVASGAIVIATSSSEDKLKIASKLGAKHVINYKKTPNWDEEVMKMTNGVGVDHVVEVGGPGTLIKSIRSVRFGGHLHLIGFLSQENSNVNVVLEAVSKGITLRGIEVGSVAQFNDMNRLLSANPEKTRPVVDKIFPFEDAKQAYAYLKSQAHLGKVVIKVSND
ncbi:hypothetical protein BDZ94DRAFT_1253518 [Collybia nuda]|uniref:Enoyl reductase (ER) domain-containing protein n=1 Tax=Collybia nuda TaxID=64659 RepID=A0A9P6CGY5_9AGAR|nr:hypothetical protein BDZ94DRAFT_1253518 [Collybia nuda]